MLKYIGEFEKLKDYWFIEQENYYENVISIGFKEPNNNKSLIIYKNTREIVLITFANKELVETKIPEKLYDLIKDGLVEKVNYER